MILPSSLVIYFREWGLIDPSLRASNEGTSEAARSASTEDHQRSIPFTSWLPPAANSVLRGGRSRSRRGGSGLCAGDSAWR